VRGREQPTSIRLDPGLLRALQRTADHMGIKRAVLIRQCVRIGLAEVIKTEALIARITSGDYNSTPIGEVNVVPPHYLGDGS